MAAGKMLRMVLVFGMVGAALAASVDQSPIYIDSGNPNGFLDTTTGIQWMADQFYSPNGTIGTIPTGNLVAGMSAVDQTLRVWKRGDSCYEIPVAPEKGRYLIRLSFCYNNYDSEYTRIFQSNGGSLSIGVSVEEYFVEAVGDFGWQIPVYYTDYIATITDGNASICFLPLQSSGDGLDYVSPPFVNSIQVLPVDNGIFTETAPDDVVLSAWARINSGGSAVVPTATDNKGYRTWTDDLREDPSVSDDLWKQLSASQDIVIQTTLATYGLPQDMLRSAREATGNSTGYLFSSIRPVNTANNFLVVVYLAEVDTTVQPNQRGFKIIINNVFSQLIDLAAFASQGQTVYIHTLEVELANLTQGDDGTWEGMIEVVFLKEEWPLGLPPLVNGIEIYEIIKPYVEVQQPGAFKARVDCGGGLNYTDGFGNIWQSDNFFSSGSAANALQPNNSITAAMTLRYFDPLLSSQLNCYSVPVPTAGRYLIRGLFDYGNWDTNDVPPVMTLAIEGVALERFSPTGSGTFKSAMVSIEDLYADFCVIGDEGSSATLINSVEVLQVNESAYIATSGDVPSSSLLYLLYRINSGGTAFGDLLTDDTEKGLRQWYSDEINNVYLIDCSPSCLTLHETNLTNIVGIDQAPYFWPKALFQDELVATPKGRILYNFTVFKDTPVLVYLLFIESNNVVKAGDRTFTVKMNGEEVTMYSTTGSANYTTVDVYAIAGYSTVLALYTKYVPAIDSLTIELGSPTTKLGPLLTGVEIYGVFPKANRTELSQKTAMYKLKESLGVKEFIGWQGDPCAPVAWRGVTCVVKDDTSRISAIQLPNSELDGYIYPDISYLVDLKSLDLSGNTLTGNIPNTITDLDNLVYLDLSNNKFNGTLPDDLGTGSLPALTYLNLANNNLQGQLPADLVQAPSSLSLNYSGNPYLCGGQGLLDCANVPPYGVPLPALAPPTSTGGGSGGGIGMIVGVIIGVVVLLAVLGAVAFFVRRQRQRRRNPLAAGADKLQGSTSP